ncbi:MAG TPA: FHA domain-containing protein [Gemmatimonadaceae bacterium]|nr:FHA domain-containing protein [Gemmatimonadaceae bacterium]
MPWLAYGGRLRKLPEGTVVVGSAPDADLRVEDAELMPHHFVLEPREKGVEVSAHSADVVVSVAGHQIGRTPHLTDYGAPIFAGSAEFHVWREQPAQREPGVPAAVRTAYLVDTSEGAAFPLDRLSTPIGRASANFIRLSDPTASRFHAQIRREAGGFALYVAGSAGGSVNGRRVAGPRLLEEGDTIELAYSRFRFTRGPLPAGVRIIPPPRPGDSDSSERPTMVRERASLGQPRPGEPPRILRTAVLIGVALALAVALWFLSVVLGR